MTQCLSSSLKLDTDTIKIFKDYFANQDTTALLDFLESSSDLAQLLTCNDVFINNILPFTNVNATACADALLQVQMQQLTTIGEWSNWLSVKTSNQLAGWVNMLFDDVEDEIELINECVSICSP